MKEVNIFLPTAAAVLAFGELVQSPIPKTLLYFVCCKVSLLTLRNPAASTKGEHVRSASGALIGGVACSISY